MDVPGFAAGEREVKKAYIGDSVYVAEDDLGRVVLTTENGYGPSNIIVLEEFVLDQLLAFLLLRTEERGKVNDD